MEKLKVNVTRFKKLQLKPRYNCVYGDELYETISLDNTKIEKAINRDIENAITFVIQKYENLLQSRVIDEAFEEKGRQAKHEFDYQLSVHNYLEGLDIENSFD